MMVRIRIEEFLRRLDEADARIVEVPERAIEKVRIRHVVGVDRRPSQDVESGDDVGAPNAGNVWDKRAATRGDDDLVWREVDELVGTDLVSEHQRHAEAM